MVRDQQGELEDRFFPTLYFGSGPLFLAMVFVSTAIVGAIQLAVNSDANASGARRSSPSVAP